MPIDFKCANCQTLFTVADPASIKQERCKECGHLNSISDPLDTEKHSVPATFEVSSSVNGSIFGPADKPTLDQWVREGRVTPECKIKELGAALWKPAKEMFPQLAAQQQIAPTASHHEAIADAPPHSNSDPFSKFRTDSVTEPGRHTTASTLPNPYEVTSAAKKPTEVYGQVVPTSGDIGFILRHAFDTYKRHTALLVGAFFIYMILAGISGQIPTMLSAALDIPGAVIGFLLNLVISAFLGAGMLNLSLKAARGESAELGDLFASGDRVLPLLGYTITIYAMMLIPVMVVGFIIGLVGAVAEDNLPPVGIGLAVAVLLLFLLMLGLLFWSSYFLIADRKTKVLESFPVGLAIGRKNILQIIAIFFIAGLVGVAGILLLFVGVFLTAPFAFLIISTAYLVMSGQVRQ